MTPLVALATVLTRCDSSTDPVLVCNVALISEDIRRTPIWVTGSNQQRPCLSQMNGRQACWRPAPGVPQSTGQVGHAHWGHGLKIHGTAVHSHHTSPSALRRGRSVLLLQARTVGSSPLPSPKEVGSAHGAGSARPEEHTWLG